MGSQYSVFANDISAVLHEVSHISKIGVDALDVRPKVLEFRIKDDFGHKPTGFNIYFTRILFPIYIGMDAFVPGIL